MSHSTIMLSMPLGSLHELLSSLQEVSLSPASLCLGWHPSPTACGHLHSRAQQPGSRRGDPRRYNIPSRHSHPQWREMLRTRVRVRRSLTSAPLAWQRRWRCSTDWLSLQSGLPAPEGTHGSAGPTLATRHNPSHWEIWSR